MKRIFSNPLVALAAGLCLRLFIVLEYPASSGDTVLYEQIATNWLRHHVYGMEVGGAVTPVDLRMPGLSGIEVCKQMRAAGMKTPLIVLSAIGDEMDKVLLLEIGADDYVVKPFGSRELLARIRALLRRSSTEEMKVVSFGDVRRHALG